MLLSQIAEDIYEEDINEDSDYSVHFINLWLISNIGALNNAIGTCYVISNSLASPELGNEEAVVFRAMFMLKFFNDKLLTSTGAAANDSVASVTSDGSTVRKFSKNELSKVYVQSKRDSQDQLKAAINYYKMNKSLPVQVAGKDVENTEPGDLVTNSRNS